MHVHIITLDPVNWAIFAAEESGRPDIFPRLLRKAREMSVTFGWPHFISDQT
jgi:hypothetical protein